MKIKSIAKQKNGKYKIKLDDNSSIITYDSVIINNNILYHKDLDESEQERINKENKYYDIYNEVLKYAHKKNHTEKEIITFIEDFDLEKKDKEKLIDKLKETGVINDTYYIRAYIHDRMMLSDDGPVKIKNDLLKKGLDLNIIDDELEKVDYSYFSDKYKRIITKKINNNKKYPINILKRKISNEMNILGYDTSNIDIYFENMDNSLVINKEFDKLYHKYSLKYKDEELEDILFKKLYNKGFNREEIENLIKKNNF